MVISLNDAQLNGRGHFDDGDAAEVTQLALAGLIQQPAA
jgi:hypothetical protein